MPTARPPRVEELRPLGLPIMDAAHYLGVSRWTVQRLRSRRELEGFRIGAAAIDLRLTRSTRTSPASAPPPRPSGGTVESVWTSDKTGGQVRARPGSGAHR